MPNVHLSRISLFRHDRPLLVKRYLQLLRVPLRELSPEREGGDGVGQLGGDPHLPVGVLLGLRGVLADLRGKIRTIFSCSATKKQISWQQQQLAVLFAVATTTTAATTTAAAITAAAPTTKP